MNTIATHYTGSNEYIDQVGYEMYWTAVRQWLGFSLLYRMREYTGY